ncbi:MAG: CDP-archaeol synthase [Candidatus Thermoplasmatota archaeon]|nr:CDP-archaeol synthase [Candidatus Thermoplasmatota archaeon]
MAGELLPNDSIGAVLLNIASVIILFGPAYLANTGAMLFGKWIPDLLKFESHKIDFGRNWSDGNRILGDGKSWEGLFGGAVLSAVLTVIAHILWEGRITSDHRPFLDPVGIMPTESFAYQPDPLASAAIVGFMLGLSCMIGDSCGSFVKRRRGLRREGDISSRAPLLDTIPFAMAIFMCTALLFEDTIFFEDSVMPYVVALLILTPVMHRLTNILGYRLGLKSVPY